MIPKFTFYFYPFLNNLNSRGNCRLFDLCRYVGEDLNLSEADLGERTKGGRVTKHISRMYYCASYLKRMNMVDNFSPGSYRITETGVKILKKFGNKLTLSQLRELPEYLATQINENNTEVVYIKPHLRGKKYIAPYICSKNNITSKNKNIEQNVIESFRLSLKRDKSIKEK